MLYSLVKTDMERLRRYLISWEHSAPKERFCLDRGTFSNRRMIQSQDPSETNSFNTTQQVQETKTQKVTLSFSLEKTKLTKHSTHPALPTSKISHGEAWNNWAEEETQIMCRHQVPATSPQSPTLAPTAVPSTDLGWPPLTQSCTSPLIPYVFELFPYQPAALGTKFPVESERWEQESHAKIPKLICPLLSPQQETITEELPALDPSISHPGVTIPVRRMARSKGRFCNRLLKEAFAESIPARQAGVLYPTQWTCVQTTSRARRT